MPEKLNYAGQMQPYDESDGQYKRFSSFHRPRDYDSEIKALKEKSQGLSIFSPERKKITEQIQQLEAEKNGFKSYNELAEYRHNQVLEKEKSKNQYKEIEQKEDYMMSHRPTETGITADNLTNQNVETPMPDNYYDILNKQANSNKFVKESLEQLNKVKGNPNAEITIYRATMGDKINDGDWITLSKSYANEHNLHSLNGKGKVLEMKVKAKDIQFAGDEINEWGYFPKNKEKNYLDGYIENNKFLDNFDEKTRESFIENFKNLPKSQQYYYSLPKEEQFSLNAMQMDTRNINEYMSGRRTDFDDELKKDLDERIKNVKSAISKYNLEQPITLYRGVGKDEFDRVQTDGKTTSFKSASTDEKIANNFAKNQGGYIIEYKVGKGSRVADVDGLPMADENEYLIDSDVKYKKITKNGNRIIVEI